MEEKKKKHKVLKLIITIVFIIFTVLLPFIYPIMLKILIWLGVFSSISEFKSANFLSPFDIGIFILITFGIVLFVCDKYESIINYIQNMTIEFDVEGKKLTMTPKKALEMYNKSNKENNITNNAITNSFANNIKEEAKNLLLSSNTTKQKNLDKSKIEKLEQEVVRMRYIAAYEVLNDKLIKIFDYECISLDKVYNELIPYYIKRNKIKNDKNKTKYEKATDIITKKIKLNMKKQRI